jgi:hypothetical protein
MRNLKRWTALILGHFAARWPSLSHIDALSVSVSRSPFFLSVTFELHEMVLDLLSPNPSVHLMCHYPMNEEFTPTIIENVPFAKMANDLFRDLTFLSHDAVSQGQRLMLLGLTRFRRFAVVNH